VKHCQSGELLKDPEIFPSFPQFSDGDLIGTLRRISPMATQAARHAVSDAMFSSDFRD
jgi:hypothetical protein